MQCISWIDYAKNIKVLNWAGVKKTVFQQNTEIQTNISWVHHKTGWNIAGNIRGPGGG